RPAVNRQRICGLEIDCNRHVGAREGSDRPSDQQCPRVKPPCIEPDHYRRQGLDNPDAAEQLQLNGVLQRTKTMNTSAPNLTTSDTHLAIWDSCLSVAPGWKNSR